MKPFLNYPGGKDGNGTIQNIVNLVPEHEHYFELFLGNGAVFRGMNQANRSTLNDLDRNVIDAWIEANLDFQPFDLYQYNAIHCIANKQIWQHDLDQPGNFIFLDPPYRFGSRKTKGKIYNCEMSDSDHSELLFALTNYTQAKIMICHYPDTMYDNYLHGWHKHDYKSMTRAGMADERLYMNYAKPERLHDYRYIGADFTNRQQLKRIRENMINKLSRLDPVLRNCILSDISQHFLTMSDQSDPS